MSAVRPQASLGLAITTPLDVLVDEPRVRSVLARDASGAFGILPRHADFVTRLPASVLSWRGEDGAWRHCALRGGVLLVSGGTEVRVACREGLVGDDLARLAEAVRAYRLAEREDERSARADDVALHARALRRIVQALDPLAAGASIVPGPRDAP